jgi:hypothetical protein
MPSDLLYRFSKDALWQKAFRQQIEPYINSYSVYLDELVVQTLNDDFALYDNYFALELVEKSLNECKGVDSNL